MSFSQAKVSHIITYEIGNKLRNESILLSNLIQIIDDNLEKSILNLFYNSFKEEQTLYNFTHSSDLNLNEIYIYSQNIFNNKNNFIDFSQKMAKHLYEYSLHPNITFNLDKSNQLLTTEYTIRRRQSNKSWHEQVDIFKGKVIVDCSKDELEIITKSVSTAKETLHINRDIINYIKEQLKIAKEEKILMNDMTNEEILQFLLAFTNDKNLTNIEFSDIISIDIEIDESITLPNDSQIKWMEEKIKKLKLDGKKIEDIDISTDSKNHQYLKCWGIVASYKFDNSLVGKGSVKIDLKFNSTNKNEFFIQINKIEYDKKIYSYSKVEDLILSEIDNIKSNKHKEIMEKKDV